jgi:hydroxymethylbilane synthase
VPNTSPTKLTIASRESKLALWQAEHVRARLMVLYPRLEVVILGMTTRGDQILDRTLSKVGGKGLFVKELETALERGVADIAVHSMKDVPMELPPGFSLSVAGGREDSRDAFVSREYRALADLPVGAAVGTSSLRRESQIRACFPNLDVRALRGNVETRLRKLDEGQYAAIILAAAGLIRLGLTHRITSYLGLRESIPAVGQGALGIEYLRERLDIAELLAPLEESPNGACVNAERAFSRRLAGSCDVPLGGHASIKADVLTLLGFIGLPDGTHLVHDEIAGSANDAEALGRRLAERLLANGGAEILNQLGGMDR